jgi:Flp pilus assembly protein TadB
MSFKRIIISLFVICFTCLGVFAEDGHIFSERQQEFIQCAKSKTFALNKFLDASMPADQKDFIPTACGSSKPIKMPEWLDKELVEMDKNVLWEVPLKNGSTEYLSEAELWRKPFLAINELLGLAQTIDAGATFATKEIMENFGSFRINFILYVERIKTNPRLISYDMNESMQGRGRAIIPTLDLALQEVDSMAEAFVSSNWKEKFRKSTIALAILSNKIYNDIVNLPAPQMPIELVSNRDQILKIREEQKQSSSRNKLLITVLMTLGTLLVFAATYKIIDAKNKEISRLVDEYMQKSTAWADDYSRQFLDINVKYIVLGTLLVFCAMGVFFAIVSGGFFGIFMFFVFFAMGLIIGLKMPGMILDSLKKRRGAKINKQLMDALILLSNSLKSGMDIVQGFERVSSDLLPPISDEFGLVIKNYKLGTPFEKSLENMEERVESRLLSYMVKAIVLQRQVGGNLTKIFERIVENIREESKLEEKLQAMTAQQRIQSIVVAVMPWIMVGVLFMFQPDVMIRFYTKPIGVFTLFGCIIWIFIGIKLVKKLGEIKV